MRSLQFGRRAGGRAFDGDMSGAVGGSVATGTGVPGISGKGNF